MKTIVWDVDDVLNELTRAWLETWWLPAHPQCTLRYEDLAHNPPYAELGISHEAYLASLDAFRQSDLVLHFQPVPQILAWFERHGQKARHLVLTGTPLTSASRSAAWVMTHFGRWVRSFNFVPSYRTGLNETVYDRTKAEFLTWLGQGDVLVEDSLANARSAQAIGLHTVLVPHPWNRGVGTLEDVLKELTEWLERE